MIKTFMVQIKQGKLHLIRTTFYLNNLVADIFSKSTRFVYLKCIKLN